MERGGWRICALVTLLFLPIAAETNSSEEDDCETALSVCPVGAIVAKEEKKYDSESNKKEPVLASSNVKATIDKHPQIKDVLLGISPKFKKILNPVMYNTLARFYLIE